MPEVRLTAADYLPLTALITLDAQHYRAEACPMCKQGLPLQNLR